MSSWLGFIVLLGSIVFGSIGYLIGRPKTGWPGAAMPGLPDLGWAGLGFWLPRRTGRSDARSTASRQASIAQIVGDLGAFPGAAHDSALRSP
jgi:hypothetical protein